MQYGSLPVSQRPAASNNRAQQQRQTTQREVPISIPFDLRSSSSSLLQLEACECMGAPNLRGIRLLLPRDGIKRIKKVGHRGIVMKCAFWRKAATLGFE